MPIFTVRRRVDAYVDYLAEIEAETPQDAAELADEDETAFSWEPEGVSEFDTRLFVALDDQGAEIAGTETGRLAYS